MAKYTKKTPLAPTLGDPSQREDPILGYRRRAPAGWTNYREPTPLFNAAEEAIRDTIRRWNILDENKDKFSLTKDNILQTLIARFTDLDPDQRVEYVKTGLVTLNRVYDREVQRIMRDREGMKRAAPVPGIETVSTPPAEAKPAAQPKHAKIVAKREDQDAEEAPKRKVRAAGKNFTIIGKSRPKKRNYG
jgi:hypothetical protein